MNSRNDVHTIRRSITLRKDVYDRLLEFLRSGKYEGMYYLRESTLICLILDWALNPMNGMSEKAILELYAKGEYARMPEKPRGLHWEKKLLEKKKRY